MLQCKYCIDLRTINLLVEDFCKLKKEKKIKSKLVNSVFANIFFYQEKAR